MRLIDADKLKDRQFAIGDGDRHAVEAVVSVEDIDAAPTIACETCEHAPCDLQWCPSMSLYEPKEQK